MFDDWIIVLIAAEASLLRVGRQIYQAAEASRSRDLLFQDSSLEVAAIRVDPGTIEPLSDAFVREQDFS